MPAAVTDACSAVPAGAAVLAAVPADAAVPAAAVDFISMLSGKHCVVLLLLLLLLTVRDIRFTIPHPAWDEVHVAL